MLYAIVDFVLSPIGTIVSIATLCVVGVGSVDIRSAWKAEEEARGFRKKGRKYVQRR